ncbi:AAA family ATPase [Variovorax paradoxus]|uniref:AAA family ATPase n=1 Tax=Variovorax paradoxus TaxID=34073 RepID=UPI003ED0F2EA
MRLISFLITKLHGFLDIPLTFNNDLTVIVGVNGSGKTSALTLMTAILRLDLVAITQFKFEAATLLAEGTNGDPISVQASCNGTSLELSLEIDKKVHKLSEFNIGTNDGIFVRDIGTWEYQNEARIAPLSITVPYINISNKYIPSDELMAAKKFLAQSKLTFVQLDRTIVAIDPDGEEAIEKMWRPTGNKKAKPPTDPINEVSRVTTQKYLEYKSKTVSIKDSAYRDSLRLHFDPIGDRTKGRIDHASLTKKLEAMKSRVAKSALTSDEGKLKVAAEEFFTEFEALLVDVGKQKSKPRAGRRTLGEEQLDAILTIKNRQIDRLLEVFEDEARATQEAYAPIRRYLTTVDKFFRENGKRLLFDADYKLGFVFDSLDRDPRSTIGDTLGSIKELSSGERQILIILTYLAFVSGKDSVFVIDEPELSLHLVWQRLLIDAIKELRPPGCQVILATHAPEIAGRALDKSIRLGRRSVK